MNNNVSAFINLMLIQIAVQVTHVTSLCIRRNVISYSFYFKNVLMQKLNCTYIRILYVCVNVFVYKNVNVY